MTDKPTGMTPEIAKQLREPFPPDVVGKLPRVWCGACREATKANRRQSACEKHRMVRCDGCHNRITDGHLHLDYVGHAETTDRFLAADPEWTWEPFALGADGLPKLDSNGGLWIRLTIAGVTRLGYGAAEGKTGPDAVKETIGDALRNAGMRFGVALDLWGAKFKASDGESIADDHEDWESASPATKEQADLFTDFQTRIAAAKSKEDLAAIGAEAQARKTEGGLTAWQYSKLANAASRRLAVLRAQEPPQAEPDGEAS